MEGSTPDWTMPIAGVTGCPSRTGITMQTNPLAADGQALAAGATKTNARWVVVAVLFFITAINYADRATISLAGPAMAKELNFDSVTMGYTFSAFG